MIKRVLLISATAVCLSAGSVAAAGHPDCSSVDAWATIMAFVHLRNAGITDNAKVDFTKTRTIRLASQKIGDDLYRQIHRIRFTEVSGHVIEVITRNDASSVECSMSGVDVFVISRHLGG
jgi:hypothetical protein